MQEYVYIPNIFMFSMFSYQLHPFVVIYNNQAFVNLNTVSTTNSETCTFCSKNIILPPFTWHMIICWYLRLMLTNHNCDYPDLYFEVMFLYVDNTFLRSSMHIFLMYNQINISNIQKMDYYFCYYAGTNLAAYLVSYDPSYMQITLVIYKKNSILSKLSR